ncbi:MAG: Gfo/Idh/MocA family oxidoreductase [Nitriliruptoraceae bacterium]|nr:Gfo/Idh/MocA family oxidoreductase [Nitriliruptoraceae bacterium]
MARHWGIMGTGGIAVALLEAIRAEGDEVVAVSSASTERAAAFAMQHAVARSYGTHHELTTDPQVEVVYVATTNETHHLDVRACIDAGLPVLAEKPFALDLPRSQDVLAAARDAGVFVMEAMWMRVQPGFLDLHRRIAEGEIGRPRLVMADFGFPADTDTTRRWYDLAQGGGALLDVGIYPLTLITSVLGAPREVRAVGELASTGVDEQVAVAMRHETGVSSWTCSFVADSGVEATVAGDRGSLRLRGPLHHSPGVTRRRGAEQLEHATVDGHELGYRHEVREVQRCLDAEAIASPAIPHAATLEVMAILDEIRGQLGVHFPN